MDFRVKSRRVVADVECNLTPREWQLFSDMPGVGLAARSLNETAVVALSLATREEAYARMMREMDRLADFGAADTEPRAVFAEMLDEVFGPEKYV